MKKQWWRRKEKVKWRWLAQICEMNGWSPKSNEQPHVILYRKLREQKELDPEKLQDMIRELWKSR